MGTTIGDRLKELRLARGLTLEQAGEIADTSKQSVSQIEKGTTANPGGMFLFKWSRFYGVDLEWLITGKGEPLPTSQPMRITPQIISATQETLALYLRFTEQAPELGRDPELLAATLEAVLESGGDLSEMARTEAAIRLANKLRRKGGVNAGNKRGDAG